MPELWSISFNERKIKMNNFIRITFVVAAIIFMLHVLSGKAFSQEIDLKIIAQIESSGNPLAHNVRSGARGLHQITKICLEEWNNYHPRQRRVVSDLFDAKINTKIASWYINERIPQMLRHYKKADTTENRLIAYNAGISYVVSGKKLPTETVNYIKKYKGLK